MCFGIREGGGGGRGGCMLIGRILLGEWGGDGGVCGGWIEGGGL